MKRASRRAIVGGLLTAAGAAACRSAAGEPAAVAVRPVARSGADRTPTAAAAGAASGDSADRRHSAADVRFIQHMMAHHAQALVMTSLVPTRGGRQDLRLLAERIERSQRDELALMRRWLEERGEPVVPNLDAHREHHERGGQQAAAMPGLLTPEELDRLARATGADFDRLFLQFMIRHHEGALAMVAELLASPGAGQEAATFRILSDVDADQRAEVARMRAMLGAAPTDPHRH